MVQCHGWGREGGVLDLKVADFLRPQAQVWYLLFARTGIWGMVAMSKTQLQERHGEEYLPRTKQTACWVILVSTEMHWSTATVKVVW